MDVCPTTILRKFEESEDDQSIDDRFKKSPASAKKSGYQTLPDGGEWSAEDDSDTPPLVRTQDDERRSLLGSANKQKPLTGSRMPVTLAQSSTLSTAISIKNLPLPLPAQAVDAATENSTGKLKPGNAGKPAISQRKKLRSEFEGSSLVSDSSEDDDSLPKVGKKLPERNPDAPPRFSSLPSNGLRPDPVSPYGDKAQLRAKAPKKATRPATPKELASLKAIFRERAMSDFKYNLKWNRFAALFDSDNLTHIDHRSKVEALMGYVEPICSKYTSAQEQQAYYDEVCRLFKLNFGELANEKLSKNSEDRNKLPTQEEKDDHRNSELKNLMWKLTPNQRHGLRQQFKLLYGNSTLADDTNWMFFDTIIRSNEMNHDKQLILMEKIFSASKEERLNVRYSLQLEEHRLLTKEESENLKRVCKKRHDNFLYSRLPLLQVIIMEKNEVAFENYISTLYEQAEPKYHDRLLSSKCLTMGDKPEPNGESAFFTAGQWGTLRTVKHFLLHILRSETLSFEEKYYLGSAFRKDGVGAMHMIMAGGDIYRTMAFVMGVVAYLDNKADPFDAFHDELPNTITLGINTFYKTMHRLCEVLVMGRRADITRTFKTANGYTAAIDHGHKKFAKDFYNRIKHGYCYFTSDYRPGFCRYDEAKYDSTGELLPEAKAKQEEGRQVQIDQWETMLGWATPEKRQEMIAEKWNDYQKELMFQFEKYRILLAREIAIKEGRPINPEKTVSEIRAEAKKLQNAKENLEETENYYKALRTHAFMCYAERDQIVALDNRQDKILEARKKNLKPLRSVAKKLSPSPKKNQHAASAKPKKDPPYRRPAQHSPSIHLTYRGQLNADGSRNPDFARSPSGRLIGPLKFAKFKKTDAVPKPSPDKNGYVPVGDESEGG